MRFFAVALFFFGAASYGQTPEVPHKMQFAGMTLTIRDDAKREIQKDVDALTQHPRYFNIKVERAKTYFPIIEKIFAEERLPDDFKFLALQESALISDAVSVSDAVGFWQFKDFTAMEMGLRVDKEIDERMNLVSATRAAAKYLKQNNYMFNNWLYALQSYQMGAGGVQRAVGDQHNGAKHMEITSETYWYVKKYLAHKVAFESALIGEAQLKVIPFETSSGKSLSEIASEVSVEENKLLEFNKWVKSQKIPLDKPYTVLIPVGEVEDFNKLRLASAKNEVKPAQASVTEKLEIFRINDIAAVKARKGESLQAMAERATIDLSAFLKYNDISIDHTLVPDAFYFLDKKKAKSQNEFYKTTKDEDVWSLSQHTGVLAKKIRKHNELADNQKVPAGSLIWLNGPKPKVEMMPTTNAVAMIDDESEFDWDEKSDQKTILPINGDRYKQNILPTARSLEQDTAQQVIPTSKISLYTVNQGETLYSIAKSYDVEIANLLTWNKLNIADGLKPGQVLALYDPESVKQDTGHQLPPAPALAESQIHEVQPSDTLYSVARKYGVTIKELMDWNAKTDLSLTVGEKLRIMQR